MEGQTHGNIHFGLSQTLYEEAIYDQNGQILTDDFLTYPIARASGLPTFELDRLETPCPYNPLGAKGAGDVANVATRPAIVNAICDALQDLGVKHLDMPVTPEKVWRAMTHQS